MLRRNGDSREGCWTPAPGGAFFKFRGSKLGCGRGLRSREDAVWRTDLGPGRVQAPHWQLTRGAAPAPPGCLCFCLHHLPKCSNTRPILFNMCPWETSPPPLPSLELLRRLFCGGAERGGSRQGDPRRATSRSVRHAFQLLGRLRSEARNSFAILRKKPKARESSSCSAPV